MLRGRGQYLLMVDADGATVASELGALEARLRATEQDGHGIAVGSRAHLQEQAVATVRAPPPPSPSHRLAEPFAATRTAPDTWCLDPAPLPLQRKWYRNILMYGFHALVMFLCGGHGVRDTQCGFKLFTRRTARILFSTLHIERWAFDVELLFVAARLRVRIVVSRWA